MSKKCYIIFFRQSHMTKKGISVFLTPFLVAHLAGGERENTLGHHLSIVAFPPKI